jgi:hypothetical protein
VAYPIFTICDDEIEKGASISRFHTRNRGVDIPILAADADGWGRNIDPTLPFVQLLPKEFESFQKGEKVRIYAAEIGQTQKGFLKFIQKPHATDNSKAIVLVRTKKYFDPEIISVPEFKPCPYRGEMDRIIGKTQNIFKRVGPDAYICPKCEIDIVVKFVEDARKYKIFNYLPDDHPYNANPEDLPEMPSDEEIREDIIRTYVIWYGREDEEDARGRIEREFKDEIEKMFKDEKERLIKEREAYLKSPKWRVLLIHPEDEGYIPETTKYKHELASVHAKTSWQHIILAPKGVDFVVRYHYENMRKNWRFYIWNGSTIESYSYDEMLAKKTGKKV